MSGKQFMAKRILGEAGESRFASPESNPGNFEPVFWQFRCFSGLPFLDGVARATDWRGWGPLCLRAHLRPGCRAPPPPAKVLSW